MRRIALRSSVYVLSKTTTHVRERERAFDHTTGQGYVKSQRGHYHHGIFTPPQQIGFRCP